MESPRPPNQPSPASPDLPTATPAAPLLQDGRWLDIATPPAALPGGASKARRTDGPSGRAFAFMLGLLLLVVTAGVLTLDRRVGLFGGAGGTVEAGPDLPVAAPICDSVDGLHRAGLDRGFALAQRTAEGRRLVAPLAEHDICVSVRSLPNNAGYAESRRGLFGGWSKRRVAVDDEVILYVEPDVLAAILVHEAAHIDRSIGGERCGAFDDCQVLTNGVTVEEEVAAHAAEARWWIAIYGPGGRRVNAGYGYSIDNLAAAYLQGPEAFRTFVVSIRSGAEEGQAL